MIKRTEITVRGILMKEKKTSIIQTLDGLTVVEWWEKEHFGGRINRLYTTEKKGIQLDTAMVIPDDLVVCDLCNARIEDYPVPVVSRCALCPSCYKDINKAKDVDKDHQHEHTTE